MYLNCDFNLGLFDFGDACNLNFLVESEYVLPLLSIYVPITLNGE
jgi:hypothetical protein